MGDADCHPKILVNQDIGGLGVRLAFYIQVILVIVLGVLMPEAVPQNSIITLFTSVILLVAAFINMKTTDMTVTDHHLLSAILFSPFNVFLAQCLASYSYKSSRFLNKKKRMKRRYFLTRAIGLAVGLIYLALYSAWTMGPYPSPAKNVAQEPKSVECSNSEDRKLNKLITATSFIIVGQLFYIGLYLPLELRGLYLISPVTWKSGYQKNKDWGNNSGYHNTIQGSSKKQGGDNLETERQEGIRPIACETIEVPRTKKGVKICFGIPLILQILLITQIETTIAHGNFYVEGKAWSYGQITALSVAILQALHSLCQFSLKWWDRKSMQGLRRTNTKSVDGSITTGYDNGGAGIHIRLPEDIQRNGNDVPVQRRPQHLQPAIESLGRNVLELAVPRRMNQTAFTVPPSNLTRMWHGNETMWRSAFFIRSRDLAFMFSPPQPLRLGVNSPSLLRELPRNLDLETAECAVLPDFQAAVQSPVAPSFEKTDKHAQDTGYAAGLRDMLRVLQSGISEDANVGVARMMDWAERQLERHEAGQEFEKMDNDTSMTDSSR